MPHHLTHAAAAYFPSGFDRAAILSIDGIGEVAGSTLLKAEGQHIRTVDTFDYPNSLGFLWEVFSGYLGFSHYDASKVMGLAAYGNPEVFRRQFQSVLRVGKEDYAVAPEFIGFQSDKFDRLDAMFGPARYMDPEILPRHADIAAVLQEATNAAVMALVRRLKRKVPLDHLCLAGGVALNCVTNEVVRQSGDFSEVFIPSAPHDAEHRGRRRPGRALRQAEKGSRRGYSTPYLGPEFNRREILAAVKSAGLTSRRSKAPAREAADMIAGGKIVAWFQGRMEFGPRALGNRSLLADPRRPDMRHILNQKVKHREDFRPFAPSVMAEHADDWFEVGAHLDEPRVHAVCACGQDRAARSYSRRRTPGRHRPGAAREPRIKSALSRAHFLFPCANRRADGHQYVLQRQRADRLHAHRCDRHLPQVRHRRVVHGRCGSDGAGLTLFFFVPEQPCATRRTLP